MKNLFLPAVLRCVFVAEYFLCAVHTTHAAVPGQTSRTTQTTIITPSPCPEVTQDVGVRAAADVLVEQLKTKDPVERERVATALLAMGENAAGALADCVRKHKEVARTTKAITILAKIGNDITDDCDVRNALLSVARLQKSDSSVLQLRLAAIDALGEINKYRGVQYSGDNEEFDPMEEAVPASNALSEIAEDLSKELRTRYDDPKEAEAAPTVIICGPTPKPTPTPTPSPTPSPTPTPTPIPIPQDEKFFKNIGILRENQPKLLELAAQASIVAPYLRSSHRLPASAKGPKTSPRRIPAEQVFTKLADAKSLAESLKKIEVAYLNATKPPFAKKPADQAEDKSHWQLKTEAAYDFSVETTQLEDELDTLTAFAESRADVKGLLSNLASIGANDTELTPAISSAINKIFSKPPEKKPAAEGAKNEAKTETDKTDAEKKEGANKDAAKK